MALYLFTLVALSVFPTTSSPTNPLYSIDISSSDPSTIALRVFSELTANGYVFVNNSHIGDTIEVDQSKDSISGLGAWSQFALNLSSMYKQHNPDINFDHSFSYSLGSATGRQPLAPGVYTVAGAPKQVLVTAHSEASYLPTAPSFLVFGCPGTPDLSKGGQTTVYSMERMEAKLMETELGRNLLNEVAEFGVIYIRNDIDMNNNEYAPIWNAVNYPFWQQRFEGMNRTEIGHLLEAKGQNVSWLQQSDGSWTLRTEWKLSGFRLHPASGQRVWFNQMHGNNGRWFKYHAVRAMNDIPLDQRPLHSLIGNRRELTDEEWDLLSRIQKEEEVAMPWDHKGDLLVVDNFRFEHGRLPYDSYRKCVIHWGPAVEGGSYQYDAAHFNDVLTGNPNMICSTSNMYNQCYDDPTKKQNAL